MVTKVSSRNAVDMRMHRFVWRNCMKNIHIHETFVDSQSANIYVRTAGNPEANEVLIILHGGPGLSHRYLRDLEQLATSDLLVVSYDQRASGLSSRSAQQEMHFSMQKPNWEKMWLTWRLTVTRAMTNS